MNMQHGLLRLCRVGIADGHAADPWTAAARLSAICARANEPGGDGVADLG